VRYLHQRLAALAGGPADDQPLFCLRGGRPINPGTVSQTFHALVPRLHLQIPPGVSPPRLHDLRHSFAVGTLTRWYRLDLDPQARRNVSTTMIQPGSKFKLGSSTLVDDLDEFRYSARRVLLAELETHQIQATH
jgi:hypothetical protein